MLEVWALSNNLSPARCTEINQSEDEIKFLFSFACSTTSGQVLDHWNVTGGQFGWDFITIVMKSNCNKNETRNLALTDSLLINALTFYLTFSGDFSFPVSLNGSNYLIISSSSSVSGKRQVRFWVCTQLRSILSNGNCCLSELQGVYWLLIEKNREWGSHHFGAAHSLWRCCVWPVTRKQRHLIGTPIPEA